MRCSGPGLGWGSWGATFAVEDRRPTCISPSFPSTNSTPVWPPGSPSWRTLDSSRLAEWLLAYREDSGGRADWRVKLDCKAHPMEDPLQSALQPQTTVRSSDNKLQIPSSSYPSSG